MPAIGGGITITTPQGATTFYQADLPWSADWRIETVRPSSERTSLAGTVIRQSAGKSITSGNASYDGLVPTAQADNVKSIDDNESTCILSDGSGIYEAEIDATVYPTIRSGRKRVVISFRVVREIL